MLDNYTEIFFIEILRSMLIFLFPMNYIFEILKEMLIYIFYIVYLIDFIENVYEIVALLLGMRIIEIAILNVQSQISICLKYL